MAQVTLNCFVHGDTTGKFFAVEIDKTKPIALLKDAIKAKKEHAFQGVDASDLDIWKVEIRKRPPDEKFLALKNNINADIQNTLGGVQVDEIDDVGEHFDDPPKKYLHIIVVVPVNRPILSSELEPIQTFNVIVKPKRTPFIWDANINESTIAEFKKKIIASWPDIDDVDEATLVIVRGTSSCTIVDDSDLRTTLKAMAVAGTKAFGVSLEMLSKPFSDYNLREVCHLFGLSQDNDPSLNVFPDFFCGSTTIDGDQVSEQALTHLINDLEALNDTTELDLTNEATRSLYVSSFLVAAVRRFKNDIVLRPEKKLRGRHGHGPVDFALESCHTKATVGVTEVKKDDIKQGIAQNTVQLEACLIGSKRKRDEMEEELKLEDAYGIVTDAKDWYFLHCEADNKTPIKFRLSKAITINWSSKDTVNSDVKKVLEHILWLLAKMELSEARMGVQWINAPPEDLEDLTEDLSQ